MNPIASASSLASFLKNRAPVSLVTHTAQRNPVRPLFRFSPHTLLLHSMAFVPIVQYIYRMHVMLKNVFCTKGTMLIFDIPYCNNLAIPLEQSICLHVPKKACSRAIPTLIPRPCAPHCSGGISRLTLQFPIRESQNDSRHSGSTKGTHRPTPRTRDQIGHKASWHTAGAAHSLPPSRTSRTKRTIRPLGNAADNPYALSRP